jgi:RnfABCDGE-type electron transport complex B subunit
MILAGILQLLNAAWPAGLTLLVLGLGFAIALLIASIKLKVETSPRVEQIFQSLPNLNCGACGFSGCMKYAQMLADNPSLIGKCAPGGAKAAAAIARVLNVQISDSGPARKPVVHCRARTEDKAFYAEYYGIETCTAANALPNAQACKFGCLGFGDCVRTCKFGALRIVDGLAAVNYEKCTGCAACVKACPRSIIEMVPFAHENMMTVACRNREGGKVTRQQCSVGCIACGICTKQSDLFKVEDNLAVAEYARYAPSEKTEAAYNKCPTGVIVYRGTTAPQPRQPKQREPAAAKG